MRLGLLVCDHVSPEFRSIAGDYPDMFESLMAGHPEVELVSYDLTRQELPSSPTECDAWITTGSRHSVYDPADWIGAFADLVRTIAAARIMLPRSMVRLSAGREAMSDELQALCFLAGANSIFHGEKLLTTGNPDTDADQHLFTRLGITAMPFSESPAASTVHADITTAAA